MLPLRYVLFLLFLLLFHRFALSFILFLFLPLTHTHTPTHPPTHPGAYDFVTKPIRLATLRASLYKLYVRGRLKGREGVMIVEDETREEAGGWVGM